MEMEMENPSPIKDEEQKPEDPAEESAASEIENTPTSDEPAVPEEVVETEETEDVEPEEPIAAVIDEQPKKDSAFKRFLNFLLGPETRVGRFMRPFLRILALSVGMFTVGLLVAYFTIYLPVRNQRDQALAEVLRANQELESTQLELNQVTTELADLESSSGTQISDLEQDIDLANFKVSFLVAKNDVLRARLALLDDNSGPGGPTALAALNELDTHLQDLLPHVENVDPVLANLLQDRLKVVKGELVRDAQQAKAELESFYANLLELEDTLFK